MHIYKPGLDTKFWAAPASCSIEQVHPFPVQKASDFLKTQTPSPQQSAHIMHVVTARSES